jgi:5,10-methylenetetrahydromethanopterin reductase
MAGKRADGLLFNGSHPDDLAWARDRVEEGLEDRTDGVDADAFDLVAYAAVSVDEDADAAREAARPPVAFIAAGAAPPVLERHGVDAEVAERVGEDISAGSFTDAFERVTPAMLDAFAVAGDREAVRERFAALLEYADSVVVGSPLGPDLDRAVEAAGRALAAASDD